MKENLKEAVAFIPEINNGTNNKRIIKLCPGLFLLPNFSKRALSLKKEIEQFGHTLERGIFLYFKGAIRDDGTLYEVFQSYALALTFFYEGLATCRVYSQIINGNFSEPEFFIKEDDDFRYDNMDERCLIKSDIKTLSPICKKISTEMANKKFNSLVNSLEFFIRYIREPEIKPRLLYLNICLESLFLAGSDSEGISYKLGLRCANLLSLSDNTVDRQITYEEVKNGYNLRSKIIHGGDYNKASQTIMKKGRNRTELDHVIILEKIVKRVFKIIFKEDEFYCSTVKGELGSRLDKIILCKP